MLFTTRSIRYPIVAKDTAQLNSARLSPAPLVFKTGHESFPFIRLLNVLVFVTHTSPAILGRFGIMAMTMKQLEVFELVQTALRAREDVVDFQ
jgi:hypothetical protein